VEFLPFLMGQAAYLIGRPPFVRNLFKLAEEVGLGARCWRAFTHDDARISTGQGQPKGAVRKLMDTIGLQPMVFQVQPNKSGRVSQIPSGFSRWSLSFNL